VEDIYLTEEINFAAFPCSAFNTENGFTWIFDFCLSLLQTIPKWSGGHFRSSSDPWRNTIPNQRVQNRAPRRDQLANSGYSFSGPHVLKRTFPCTCLPC